MLILSIIYASFHRSTTTNRSDEQSAVEKCLNKSTANTESTVCFTLNSRKDIYKVSYMDSGKFAFSLIKLLCFITCERNICLLLKTISRHTKNHRLTLGITVVNIERC